MANITANNEFLVDPRLTLMCQEIPRWEAVGSIICFWEVGQSYWKKDKGLIPKDIFFLLHRASDLLRFGFAVEQENGVYCRGAEERWGFLLKRSHAGKLGGQRSVESRRAKYGTALPENASNREECPKQIRSRRRSKPSKNPKLPKPSSSSSSSSSKILKKEEEAQTTKQTQLLKTNTDPPPQPPPPQPTELVLKEFKGIVGEDLLGTVSLEAQKAWARVFGAGFVRDVWPLVYQAWETDDERRVQGGFAQYARRFLENQKRYAKGETKPRVAEGPPMDLSELLGFRASK